MKFKSIIRHKGFLLAFIALLMCFQAVMGQDAMTSIKFTVKNYRISTDLKTISYDVYLKDIDATNPIAVPVYTFRMCVPQADLGTSAKTVTVTNGNATLGAGYPTMTASGTNWLMKFQQNTVAVTYATCLMLSDTGDGTLLGTFNISNTDGTAFANPQVFNATYSGSAINTKSTVSILLPNTTTLAPNSTVAQQSTNFDGFGSYSIAPVATQLTIGTPTLTLEKTYDGTTTAAVTPGTLSGVDAADAANVTVSATATYDNANAGSTKTITVHYTLSGTAAASYKAPVDYVVTTGSILTKSTTVTAPVITKTKTFDGTTTAACTTGTLSGVLAADEANVSITSAANYNNASVGTAKTITVVYSLSGTAAGNYSKPANTVVTDGIIQAKVLTIANPSLTTDKTYDGTTTAAVTAGALSGVDAADAANLTVAATATYNNANAGSTKTITVHYTLSGTAAAGYSTPANYVVTTGTILKKAVTVSNPTLTLTKKYDGTTTAAVIAGSLSGVIAADAANVTVSAAANYDNANVGTSKTITVAYTLSGSAATNYSAPANYVVNTGEIKNNVTQLTIANPSLTTDKTYDGTTTAAVTAGALSGVDAADAANVTVAATATYNNASAGSTKTITVHYTLSGTAAASYLAPVDYTVTTGNILKKALTVANPTITTTKDYDGTTTAAVIAGSLSGVIATDAANVTVSAAANYNNANVGTSKTITVAYTLSGSAATNYSAPANYVVNNGEIKAVNTVTALTISEPTITYSKEYDGTNIALIVPGSLIGVNAADAGNVQVSAAALYNDEKIGSSKIIAVKYTLTGTAAGKYSLNADKNYNGGEITQKQLTAINTIVSISKIYDGTTIAIITSNGTLSGVIAGETNAVSMTATAEYNSSAVGRDKTITIHYTLTGTAKDHYLAPKDSSISNASIFYDLSVRLVDEPHTNTNPLSWDLQYVVVAGNPVQYKVTFDSTGLKAGLVNTGYMNMTSGAGSGSFNFTIPAGVEGGIYEGYIQVKNAKGEESEPYKFKITIDLSSDYIVLVYKDIIAINNKTEKFLAYQWYKNGVVIPGANKQYYSDPEGLNGSYSARVITSSGAILYITAKTFTTTADKVVTVYPNPLQINQKGNLEIKGYEESALKSATIRIFNANGSCVFSQSNVEKVNPIALPAEPQIYVGHLLIENKDIVFKMIVK